MKVAIIGNGNVGLATFGILLGVQGIHEICLIGRNTDKVAAEIDDYEDSFILRNQDHPHVSSGSYDKTADADIIVYTAGVPTKPGQNRLDLVKDNTHVAKEIFKEINKYNKDAIIIVVSNPVDIITNEIAKIAERPASKIIGTGTLLDTARCQKILSQLLDISPKSLNLFVIGEHGDSSLVVMSSLRILGMTLDEYLSMEINTDIKVNKSKIADQVKAAGGKILKRKGATAYGVAAAVARLISAIINNENVILPVSAVLHGEYGVTDMAISVPCLIGSNGIVKVLPLSMHPEEIDKFNISVQTIKNAASCLE